MKNRDHDEDAPLIDGLDAHPEGVIRLLPAPEGLREAVFDRTQRIVRARARRRRVTVLVSLAAAYLCGVTTALLVTAGSGSEDRTTAAATSSAPETAHREQDGKSDPAELEEQAGSAPPDERSRLLIRAGDLYLDARYDVESALRCYRRALDARPEPRRTTVEPDDSWLLAALKDARR